MGNEKLTALVADDSQFIRQLIAEYLMGIGVKKTYQASNGADALELVEKHKEINLILCDWSMPKLDGLSFVKEAKKIIQEPCLIILITSENTPEIINRFKELGVQHALIKPFTEDDLQKILETSLEIV